MSLTRSVTAELRRTLTLPATVAAIGLAVFGQGAIAMLNAITVRNAAASGRPDLVASTSPVEAVFAAAPLGTVGAVIIGVVTISSEYTSNRSDAGGGRQIAATLIATPRRRRVLVAKLLTVIVLVAGVTAVAIPASLPVAHAVIGDLAPAAGSHDDVVARSLGVGVYWTLSALIALALTALTRSGVIPLIVLIANASLVSFSLLLFRVTALARYLPDLAGTRLYAGDMFVAADDVLGPLVGGLVMAAWTAGLLIVAAVVFARRDA